MQVETNFRDVTYYHLLLERHEIVIANNTYCESFYLGSEAQKLLSSSQKAQLEELGYMTAGLPTRPTKLARPSLRRKDIDELFRERPNAPLARLVPSMKSVLLPTQC